MNETPTAILDQAAFQRVWRRVMPQDRADCPFTLEDPISADPFPAPAPLVRAPLPPLPAQAAAPQPIPCLGEASVGELPALKTRMDAAAQARRTYRALARRAGRRGLFSSLAREKDRQLRQLSAAYFLISGEEYDPTTEAIPLPKTTPLALREQFRWEQLEAAALMEAAQSTADPCLSRLYRELAEESRDQADRLRGRLEQM